MRDWLIIVFLGGVAIAILAWSINQLGKDEVLRILPYIVGFLLIFTISVIASANRPKPGR